MSLRGSFVGLFAALGVLVVLISGPAGAGKLPVREPGPDDATAQTAAVGTIAYVRGNEIRLVGTDGQNDRKLWSAPLPEGARGIRGMQWRPDGGALAFGSGYQWLCSQYDSDIYTILANGSGLKRLTNSPECNALAAFPKGSVKVRIENDSAESLFGIYVEGAPETTLITLSPGAAADVTIPNVADLGNFPQAITVINGKYRWVDPAVTVNVVPGQTANATSPFVLSGTGVYANVGAAYPTWHRSGTKVGFLYQEGFMLQIGANPPVGGADSFILDPGAGVVAQGMIWSPVSDWLLYASSDSISVVQPGATDGGIAIINKDPLTEIVVGMDWLPDESGFIFSISSGQFGPESSNIYEYNFEQNDLRQITFFDGFAGGLSLSPTADRIVFEYAAELNDPRELMVINRDGTGLHPLGIEGDSPEWRPFTGIDFTDAVFLPSLVRP